MVEKVLLNSNISLLQLIGQDVIFVDLLNLPILWPMQLRIVDDDDGVPSTYEEVVKCFFIMSKSNNILSHQKEPGVNPEYT